ncbi:MAG: urea ABC transporter permease subunit UrtB [Chthoniobacteraceae bacterium]
MTGLLPRAVASLGLLLFTFLPAFAADAPTDDAAVRQKLVQTILSSGEQQAKLLDELSETGSKTAGDVLTAWTRDEIYVYAAPDGSKVPMILEEQQDADGKQRGFRIDNGQVVKDAKGADLHFNSDDLTTAESDMKLRSTIKQSLDVLSLSNPSADERKSAIQKLGKSQKAEYLPVLQKRLAKETEGEVQRGLKVAIATIQLNSADHATKLAAIKQISDLNATGSLDDLDHTAKAAPGDADVQDAIKTAKVRINDHIGWVNFYGTIFRGLSSGSILLVVALGLAITFGLMGVINMAHGEMIAIGAYTCYVVQNVFGEGFVTNIALPFGINIPIHLPGLHSTGWGYECYFIVAIPMAFIAAAIAGVILERCIIQFLYSRPLESLLATWGVSLFMQQCFRIVFGANNVQVNSPSWLSGSFYLDDVGMGYNRVFVIAFAVMIVIGVWLLLTKTPLGLLIRAVMQNRAMASCMGVRTSRVNMMTFALGSGLAGLAGAFLSQIGNVGPSLGQTYIVDSFMTVVVGGVGNIVGCIYSALGIGTADQVLQQVFGSPVIGKITVLICIIFFLQWKPGGLFPTRSRSLEG